MYHEKNRPMKARIALCPGEKKLLTDSRAQSAVGYQLLVCELQTLEHKLLTDSRAQSAVGYQLLVCEYTTSP